MHAPRAVDFLGHAQPARVELAQHLIDCRADLGRRAAGIELRAALPRLFDGFLQFVHRFSSCCDLRQKAAIRCAASLHSAVDATNAMRTNCLPGFTPRASRAR